jgi:HAD superfamily hydrolase (TIGR01662 family)
MSNQFPEATVKRTVYGAQAMEDYIYAPVLACDLDGTIRYNREDPDDFIDGPESVAVYDGVEEKLWEYYREGYMIAGMSNQGGVAYDFKTPEQASMEVDAMIGGFDRNPFFHIQQCLAHEDGDVSPYDRRSMLRKPNTGMLAVLEEDMKKSGYLPNWSKSIFVGDREEDKKLAERAGIEFRHADNFFERNGTQE